MKCVSLYPTGFCHGFQGSAQGAVELFRADHADLFDRSDVTGDDAVGDKAEVIVHVTQTCGGHLFAVGVAAGRDDVGTLLEQLTTSLLDDALAALAQGRARPGDVASWQFFTFSSFSFFFPFLFLQRGVSTIGIENYERTTRKR